MPSLETPRRLTIEDAVNVILKNAGVAPINSLGPNSKPSAIKAQDMLAEESIRLQSEGHNFCTVRDLELKPDATTGEVKLPNNTLSIHPVGRSSALRVQEDGGRLFDYERASYRFDSPVWVDAVLAKPWSSLPQPARWAITVAAALRFSNSENPGGANMRLTAEDLQEAEANLTKYDRRLLKGGLRVHNPHFKRLRGRR